ncbi:MAG: hypothetical protein AMXMBFR36_21800 [Acidobacteriota bacterium]
MKGRALPWALALAFAAIHLGIVVRALVSSGGVGEDQGWLVLWFDFPLVGLISILPDSLADSLYGSRPTYVAFFSIVGTAMYAGLGFVLGRLLRWALAPRNSGDR